MAVYFSGDLKPAKRRREARNISVLAAIGGCGDGKKGLLTVRNIGGDSMASWRQSSRISMPAA